jgi:protein-S-isoprenylcysteine O-methyltransferase Ste14
MIQRGIMTRFERGFVWLGGAAFVVSLLVSAYMYAIAWSAAGPFVAPAGWRAIGVNVLLFALFASHHSLFARDGAKAWLARHVPDRLLRSVYVWIASLLWTALVLYWRPIGGVVFQHTGALAAAHAIVQAIGLLLIARSVRAIDALDLAGIRRQAGAAGLQVTGPYRLVRHPLYLGWIVIVFGAAAMTGDRLVFAIVTSLYLVMAMPWEERSLERAFGEAYRDYCRHVRWRVVPYVY